VLRQSEGVGDEVVAVEIREPGGDLCFDGDSPPSAERRDHRPPQQRMVEPVGRAVVVEQARVAGLGQQRGRRPVVQPGDRLQLDDRAPVPEYRGHLEKAARRVADLGEAGLPGVGRLRMHKDVARRDG
jgi:hypothetical protein